MVFQATKWGWKRIAARLLLVPVLAGGSAAIANAQMRPAAGGPAPGAKGRPAAGPVMTAGDPKAILKEGRKALEAGRFDEAQDLARRAEASNSSGKWGLFDDTPNALLKDVRAAVAKAQKAESEQLVKKAKTLLHRHSASDGERAADLKAAMEMARRAETLHGPYSVWDLGDRADKLAKEIEAARSKLRPVPPAQNTMAGAPGTGRPVAAARPAAGPMTPGGPSGVVAAGGAMPAAGPRSPAAPSAPRPPAGPAAAATAGAMPVAPTGPSPAAADPKKAVALKLMAEGKQLANKGEFAAAQAKYNEANKLGATFGPNEATPGFALQELKAQGSSAIDRALKDAQAQTGKKEYAKAEAALNAASEIAIALGLFRQPIDEAKAALQTARGGPAGGTAVARTTPPAGPAPAVLVPIPPLGQAPVAPAGVASIGGPTSPAAPVKPAAGGPVATGLAPAGGPETLVPLGPAPARPAGVASVGGPAPALPAAPGTDVTGRQYLEQAAVEFKKGDLEVARRLALQAHNHGAQEEARGLLNSIDAETLKARQRTAEKSFQAAAEAVQRNDHEHALQVLIRIDPKLLPPDMHAKKDELVAACRAELDKKGGAKPDAGLVAAGGMQPPAGGELRPTPGANPPGSARVGAGLPADPKPTAPDGLAGQADAMRRVTFQKLRGEGLKIQADAQAAFGRGETDAAIQMLAEYSNRVRAANLDPGSVALLLKSVDSRIEMFQVMKGNADAVARLNRERKEAKELITGRGAADEQRKAEVQKLARQYHALVRESKFAEAERVALQAKQLEPDDPGIAAMAYMATINRRVREAEKLKDDKEKFFKYGLDAAEKEGPFVDTQDPVAVQVERMRTARLRGRGDDAYLRSRTPKEFEIETRLDQPISVEFNQTPLSEVVENLRTLTGLPFSYDTAALEAEAISTAKPISEKLPGVSARNALHLILDKVGLNFVIEYDTIRITTNKKAKGRLVTKVFSVADLVTPIPNFALPEYANFDKMINRGRNNPNVFMQGLNAGPGGFTPRNGLAGGTPAGAPPGVLATSPGIAGDMKFAGGGSLQSSPLAPSGNMAPDTNTKHEQLIKLVTSMIRPYSWDGMGGAGRVEYFDLGAAMVVNQTADVIREIQDLLEALRRLQDLAVAVEVRIISLSESWFERMGVDFSMNISTHNTKFEPNLTSGAFRPEPYINSLQGYKGITAGLQPAGAGVGGNMPVFTPDLAVPIHSTSFQYAVPGFGGYPNSPGADGGVSLGLAFLNDIQVYLFMEAAQGDRRVNVMAAPKLTLFNGQTATIATSEMQFFVSDVSVYSVNGQVVFVPNNALLPGSSQNGGNISIGLQAVVSADRRFVRINIPVTLAAQSGSTVPLFPVTTFITPVFEGGSQGVPIPFTQFLQQPGFTLLNIQTTVVCPDGGTVLLGGMKRLSEGRNEFGPPFLSKIPYLNRLFKNVGIGRDTSHIMIMITPRIIINAEEEINQTEGGPLGSGGPPR